jgi:phosphoribosyl-dephospho-CoA transferase
MSDISNVLRKVIELDISLGLDGTQEALDEITRLTAEVEQNAIDLEEYRRDVERLLSVTVVQETLIRKSEAENEKLRAGLWDIHAYCNNWDWFIWMWPMRRIKRIARAALSGDKHE